ncbi:hypothetical protein SteCoe_27161 [Stentor coeruleus]|uniref:FHA domain-containing protein n=1 Tax=Stentor coeruleus TaxID=5963 RepID=A0A1R2BB37_9CILI|nr:hypothetical protein SteCoe_27161 [Stentor coeruleus]
MGNRIFGCCDEGLNIKHQELNVNPLTSRQGLNTSQFSSEILSSFMRESCEFKMTDLGQRRLALSALKDFKTLKLRIVNSGMLDKDKILNIRPSGLEQSKRRADDGYVFFGCKKKLRNIIVNDFVVPLRDPELNETHRGKHFVIYYRIDKNSYWIRDLCVGFGVFVRLDYTLLLKDSMLFNIGESFLVVHFKNTQNFSEISIRVFGAGVSGESKTFNSIQDENILIGRNAASHIKISDQMLSKVQCTIFYTCTSGWMLVDGDLNNNRCSTNGTWMYLNEDFEIYNGMIFKTNQSLFEAKIE